MITVVENRTCEACKTKEAVVLCNGCGRALCADCRVFDLWCYGCGHGDPRVFCKSCNDNPDVNVWKGP